MKRILMSSFKYYDIYIYMINIKKKRIDLFLLLETYVELLLKLQFG